MTRQVISQASLLRQLIAAHRADGASARAASIAGPVTPSAEWSMPVDFLSLFALLNASGARYVLVGGLALVLHGIDRVTADVDLALDLSTDAVRAAVRALQEAGMRPMLPVDPMQLADASTRATWHRERGMQVFSFWDPSHTRPSVDVFVESPVDFETLWHAATVVTLDGIDIRVASIEHLIELKRMAARPQDLADIERLRTLLDSP